MYGDLGKSGFALEPRVRRVVAERLGVAQAELRAEVSLIDDLAVDSLDLVELAVVLEDELGVALSEAMLAEVRTYQDLVACVQALARRQNVARGVLDAATVRARIVPPPGRPCGDVQHAGRLTPYVVQTITEDALRGGRGARVELTVPPDLGAPALARLREQFAWLGERDIVVTVRRDPSLGPELRAL